MLVCLFMEKVYLVFDNDRQLCKQILELGSWVFIENRSLLSREDVRKGFDVMEYLVVIYIQF